MSRTKHIMPEGEIEDKSGTILKGEGGEGGNYICICLESWWSQCVCEGEVFEHVC